MKVALSPEVEGKRFYFYEQDKIIGGRIAINKFEPFLTKIVSAYLKPGMVVVDCGANIGWYTVIAAKMGCMVYAFEPEENNFCLLQKNVELNEVESRVKLFPYALGEKEGVTKLYVSEENLGDHRTSQVVGRKIQEVKMVKLDDMVKRRVDFIKSDTQGAEAKIFAGAKRILTIDKPTMLLEIWKDKFINLEGYFLYQIDEYVQTLGKYGDFESESVNVWAGTKSLSFLSRHKNFLLKKYLKRLLGREAT